jgi:TrmH family RNA methyltransferase
MRQPDLFAMFSKEELKELAKLKTKKGRKAQERFLIEGMHLCEEIANSDWETESVLFTSSFQSLPAGKRLLQKFQRRKIDTIPVKSEAVKKLSDTVTPQGIICVVKIKRFSLDKLWPEGSNVILALDAVNDPGNVGTLIRTADAFRIDGVILSFDSAELYNPKVVRSTMGSIFHLPIFDEVDLEKVIPKLKKQNFKIFGTDVKEGRDLDKLDYSGPMDPAERICLLIGSEAKGLNRKIFDLSDTIIRIPIYGKAESLNASVAGGILLYELTKRRHHESNKGN